MFESLPESSGRRALAVMRILNRKSSQDQTATIAVTRDGRPKEVARAGRRIFRSRRAALRPFAASLAGEKGQAQLHLLPRISAIVYI